MFWSEEKSYKSPSVGLELANPGLVALPMSPQNRLIQTMILKLLFIFISVIFERLACKGRSSYGKIITHSEVSMNESIYGQNGKVVLSPSGTLQ